MDSLTSMKTYIRDYYTAYDREPAMYLVVLLLVIGQQSVASLECLSCTNVTSLNSCHTFTSCRKDEVCYLDNFNATDGKMRFNLGCRQHLRCPASIESLSQITTWLKSERSFDDATLVCSECCFDSMCNMRGCGDNGRLTTLTTTTTLSSTTQTLPTTTSKPTTSAPTTLASTTLAPTTLAPTLAPTTLAPSTLAPTTLAPTTLAPTTLKPTTLAPTTLAPTTLKPTTLQPDICHSNPCQHGGKCVVQDSTHIKCECSGYYGDHCEKACKSIHWDLLTSNPQIMVTRSSHHLTYNQGVEFCRSHCGSLLNITGLQRRQQVEDYLTHMNIGHTYWINGRGSQSNSVWTTDFGGHIPITHDLWAADPRHRTHDHCLTLEDDAHYKLLNYHCRSQFYVLCEK